MKQTRKIQRLHEIQVARSILTETGRIILTTDKQTPKEAEKNNGTDDPATSKE